MIESLLQKIFPVQYGLPIDSVVVPIRRYNSPFTCSDEKSCVSCLSNLEREYRRECNKEILKVNNNEQKSLLLNLRSILLNLKRQQQM